MQKLTIIGDSLSMPRPDDGVFYEDTYPYLLSKELPEVLVINRAKRANDTKEQSIPQSMFDDIIYLTPDYIVIHLGIVDCAPRLFSRKEAFILSKLKFGKNHIINFASKHRSRITKLRKLTYVDPIEFHTNITKIILMCKQYTDNVLVLNIANTCIKNDQKSFGFARNIVKYNEILRNIIETENVNWIDVNSIGGDILLDDGIHLNKIGNELLASFIKEAVLAC